jgi:two-component system, chemotaxis family, chemotaxis protein CheY
MTFNILIVDDSLSMRAVIKKIINLSGIRTDKCYEAQNGREALEVLAGNWVDIILSDINMPEMDGIELLKTLRSDQLFKEIPVIFISTEANTERIKEAVLLGVKGFLKKPFVPEDLRELLYKVLGLSSEGLYGDNEENTEEMDF